jgi:hypothetical protein
LHSAGGVNPADPESAQRIVADYSRVLERDIDSASFPAPVDSLPYAKATIKAAIETAVLALASTGRLTDELHDFLRIAYVSLADYVGSDLVRLMREYNQAGNQLAADQRLAREKTGGAAWRTLNESSRLAGEIARSIATEADRLQKEFHELPI